MSFDDKKMAVIGLGYVGLPLAAEFGNIRPVIGFDIDKKRTAKLSQGIDDTLELSSEKLKSAKHLSFSSDVEDLKSCEIFIVSSLQEAPRESGYDATITDVGHHQFKDMGVAKIRQLGKPDAILYDVKSMFERDEVDARL